MKGVCMKNDKKKKMSSICCLLPSFESTDILVQEKKLKQIFKMAAILDF